MRKLVLGGILLVLAATTTQAADLREPYGPEAYGPPPRAYAPAPEEDDEAPRVHRPVRPPVFAAPPDYGSPPGRGYRPEPPPRHYGDWRERGWREGGWRPPHDSPCWLRPGPWGPERVCR